jgi:hypothetical protein
VSACRLTPAALLGRGCRCPGFNSLLAGLQDRIKVAHQRLEPGPGRHCLRQADGPPARGGDRRAYRKLALQVELCLPRLIASRVAKRVGAPFGLSAGVLARRASPTSLLLGASRVFARPVARTSYRARATYGSSPSGWPSTDSTPLPIAASIRSTPFSCSSSPPASTSIACRSRPRTASSTARPEVSTNFRQAHPGKSSPPYSRGRRRALLPTETCRSLRNSLRFCARARVAGFGVQRGRARVAPAAPRTMQTTHD